MSIPTFTWEIAFGSLPAAVPVWNTDISDLVGANNVARGRNSDLDQVEAGSGQLELLDHLADFNPRNQDSPYYPNVRPMVPIRQFATLDGVDYPICWHYVTAWPRRRVGGYQSRTLSTVDAFLPFARTSLAGLSILAGTTGDHIDAVLDYVGWPVDRRRVSTGSASVQAVVFADGDTTGALQYMQQMAVDEAGVFFVAADGAAVFISRGDFTSAPYNVSVAAFTDQPGGGGITATDIIPAYDIDHIYNDWIGTTVGGTAQRATDALSVERHFTSTRSISFRLLTDADVLDTIQHYVLLYGEPVERVEQIVVNPVEDSDIWQTMLSLEIGDRVTVTDTDLDGISRTADYFTQHIAFSRRPGSDAGAEFVLSLGPTTGAAEQPENVLRFDTGNFDTDVFGW